MPEDDDDAVEVRVDVDVAVAVGDPVVVPLDEEVEVADDELVAAGQGVVT